MTVTIPPQVAGQYNFAVLAGKASRAKERFNRYTHTTNDRDSHQLLVGAVQAMCDFFGAVLADETLWAVAASVTAHPQPTVAELVNSIDEFNDREFHLLVSVGLKESNASELADELAEALGRYQAGDLPSADDIRTGVEGFHREICASESELDDPGRRRHVLRLLARASKIAGVIVVIAANIAGAIVPSVLAGLAAVAEQTLDFAADR